MSVRIVGLGQDAAGDDGIGLHVLRAARAALTIATPEAELLELRDASRLLELMRGCTQLVIVDAVLGDPPGVASVYRLDELDAAAPKSLSSHGIGVTDAIEMSRVIYPQDSCQRVSLVTVSISQPTRFSERLSSPVEAAIPRAVELVHREITPKE